MIEYIFFRSEIVFLKLELCSSVYNKDGIDGAFFVSCSMYDSDEMYTKYQHG